MTCFFIFVANLVRQSRMTKPLTKNPHAFNGAPLTEVNMEPKSMVHSDQKESEVANGKHLFWTAMVKKFHLKK